MLSWREMENGNKILFGFRSFHGNLIPTQRLEIHITYTTEGYVRLRSRWSSIVRPSLNCNTFPLTIPANYSRNQMCTCLKEGKLISSQPAMLRTWQLSWRVLIMKVNC